MANLSSYSAFLRQTGANGSSSGFQSGVFQLSANYEVTIGREADCQIVLESTRYGGVSRHHASVRPLAEVGTWEVCDLGSSNGTFINGDRLSGCRRLQPGDRIVLGEQVIEFTFELQVVQPVVTPNSPANPPTNALSMSQLIPILSTGKDLKSKAFLIPAIVTVLCVVSMFMTIGNFVAFAGLLAFYLAGAAFFVVYRLCGKRKPWWLLLAAAIATAAAIVSPLFKLFVFVFRKLLPGDIFHVSGRAGFISHLIANFFGAGMLEELLKSLPVFICYFLGLLLAKSPRWRERLGVCEPLDGILIGAASAVGFTLLETLGQYVPNIVVKVGESSGEGAAYFVGLQLLIPRILGSVAGHMAYSGYFGYFIGLSALKPSKWWLILPIGYLTSATMHGFWNASASIGGNELVQGAILAVVGVFSYAFLAAAILKARTLSPTRSQNFATRLKL
ncbi:PrsW family glutamic-type intramembrane protease [Tumidithrix helvetica PCC 7403]|uniref:PrsW family glutamic-type intramembrane protease n=1 Tax=Tumidithrix helvetica TaxID=3457545 RepID=UPI003CBF3DE1